ncbi:MAG TPA: site-specific DNA-methyltransferase [bacterium]|nr:site-specific DNA-methyltransferase [bacterium]
MNTLYYGDNLTIMREQMGKSAVDLVYLDPPFNSKSNYNIIYRNLTGLPVPEQVEAFCDTWDLTPEKLEVAKNMPVLLRESGVEDYYVEFWRIWILALRNTRPELLAYLIYMVERLLQIRSVLKKTGSIYLHCDPTASHYIKIMMDGIFGHQNFLNEIIWKRTSAHSSAKRWGPVHDVLLFYAASSNYRWNRVHQAYDNQYLDTFYRNRDADGKRFTVGDLTGAGIRHGESGQPWRGHNPTDKGRHWAIPRRVPGIDVLPKSPLAALDVLDKAGRIIWPTKDGGVPRFKRYLDDMEGVQIQDVIDDIAPISAHGKDRLGYPTQKPIALLDRIIRASSNKGEIVFDPFCGCGTTIYAAHAAERQWIGCDIAILPIKLIKRELEKRFRLVEGKHFVIDGIPVSVEQAEVLFRKDPFQFQHWFVERVGGFPTLKRSGDTGIDGRIYFETKDGLDEMVLSVKGGNIRPTDIRDLRGVLEREPNAKMAGFLSLRPPTKAMQQEAAQAGQYKYGNRKYDRIQFLTAEDVLVEKKLFHTPTVVGVKGETGQVNLAV